MRLTCKVGTLDDLIGKELSLVTLVPGVDAVQRLEIVVVALDPVPVICELSGYFDALKIQQPSSKGLLRKKAIFLSRTPGGHSR